MENVEALIFSSMGSGVCILATWIFMTRGARSPVYWPLGAFFFISAILNSHEVVAVMLPGLESAMAMLVFGIVLLVWPAFWFYIEGITSETRWHFQSRHFYHLSPALLGVVVLVLLALWPQTTRQSFLVSDEDIVVTNLTIVTLVLLLLLVLVWSGQGIYYVVRSLTRLFSYRRRLRDTFASTENRELTWLIVVFSFFTLTLTLGLIDLFAEQQIPPQEWESFFNFILLLVFAAWSLRQAPGYEQIYSEIESLGEHPANLQDAPGLRTSAEISRTKKYEKSALDEERAKRIAGKLERIMSDHKLYLNPDLSLPTLASKLGVSRNILSQTLNETLQSSFFDYVNRHRVSASLDKLKNQKETILDIAMDVGFNSRSAFYKAFKRETGTTPSRYRKNAFPLGGNDVKQNNPDPARLK